MSTSWYCYFYPQGCPPNLSQQLLRTSEAALQWFSSLSSPYLFVCSWILCYLFLARWGRQLILALLSSIIVYQLMNIIPELSSQSDFLSHHLDRVVKSATERLTPLAP